MPRRRLKHQYPHAVIDHSRDQYVVGAVHTQTIEGFWYEFAFRYNNRHNEDIFGAAVGGC